MAVPPASEGQREGGTKENEIANLNSLIRLFCLAEERSISTNEQLVSQGQNTERDY
jgi:hypothetical protein